ncbi:hypothetical protein V6N11_065090 [Hibiscus sabdariffa]|uniref:Uncharacterized protein n=1 Tax=Hibiscus sabdariffa TaxID=183260 RepID=A0ABR2SJJ0_9ROSI
MAKTLLLCRSLAISSLRDHRIFCPLWRALSNTWETFLSNLAWSLGNGTSVNFFTNIWVPALGLLQGFSQISPTVMSQISFDLDLNELGEWDVMKLSLIFTVDVVPYILGIKPPNLHAGSDMCVWRWIAHHDFELKSAYSNWSQPALETPDPLSKQIWCLQVP